jgi:Protein of unknown function (DUF3040)
MLSDDELAALRDIERRLRWNSPELFRLFNSQEVQPATDHRKPARTRALIAAAAVTGMALLGPRMLNEAEVRTQRRRPLPRTAPADSAITERADPVSGPAAPAGPIPVAVADTYCSPRQSLTGRPPAMAHLRKREPAAPSIGNPCTSSRSVERR